MASLGDLIVKLRLNGSEFKKGLDKAGKDISSSFKNIKAGVMAVWSAIGATAVSTLSNIAHLTNTMGDEWDKTVFKMKSTWATFWRIDATGEYQNFFAKFKSAIKDAEQLYASRDDQFEAGVGLAMFRATNKQEMTQLLIDMRDQTKSLEERNKAAERYKELLKEITDLETANAKKKAEDEIEGWYGHENFGIEQIAEFLKYFANQTFRKLLSNGIEDNTGNYYEMKDLLRTFGSSLTVEQVRKLSEGWNANNDETNTPLYKAIEEYYNSLGAFAEQSRKVETLINSNTAKIEKSTTGGIPKALRDTYLDVIEDDNYAFWADQEFAKGWDRVLEKFEIFNNLPEYKDGVIALCEELTNLVELTEDMPGPDSFEMPFDSSVIDEFEANVDRFTALMEDLRDACIMGFTDGMQVLMDGLFGLEDINAGKIFSALLSPLADIAVKQGELLIAEGIGVEACKEALVSLNGIAAIAAGASLVAIGTAAKAGLSKLASSGSASSSATTSASSTGNDLTEINSSLTIYVKGSISGGDIVLSGSKTMDKWSR